MLEGKLIRLRPLRPSDEEAVYRWRNDNEVTEFLAIRRMSRDMVRNWVRDYLMADTSEFFAVETLDGGMVGYIGLRDIDGNQGSAMADIVIGETDRQNQGLGTEAMRLLVSHAFDDLGLQRVGLAVLPFNTRGIRVYEKVGFRQVGQMREWYLRRGKSWQPLRMEIEPTSFALASRASGYASA